MTVIVHDWVKDMMADMTPIIPEIDPATFMADGQPIAADTVPLLIDHMSNAGYTIDRSREHFLSISVESRNDPMLGFWIDLSDVEDERTAHINWYDEHLVA